MTSLVFKNPPLVEVVCGAIFPPIERLTTPHLGLYWAQIQDEFPDCEDQVPVAPTVERFDDAPALVFTGRSPLARVWFYKDGPAGGLIQVQPDMFLYNWRRTNREKYPRFDAVYEAFSRHLQKFSRFIQGLSLGIVKPIQFELTYVNHIAKGEGWTSLADLRDLFAGFPDESAMESIGTPDTLLWQRSYVLRHGKTRLHCRIRPAKRNIDGVILIALELTVRGFDAGSTPEQRDAWFQASHEKVVEAFAAMTTSDVQEKSWLRDL